MQQMNGVYNGLQWGSVTTLSKGSRCFDLRKPILYCTARMFIYTPTYISTYTNPCMISRQVYIYAHANINGKWLVCAEMSQRVRPKKVQKDLQVVR
jgi:hypothetical protein